MLRSGRISIHQATCSCHLFGVRPAVGFRPLACELCRCSLDGSDDSMVSCAPYKSLCIGEDGKIMILEQNAVLISDGRHRMTLSSLRALLSQSCEAGHWLAYEGRWQNDHVNIERERLCFRCCSSNVLTSAYHPWEVNDSVAGENWGAWPMTCRSRWT